MVSPEMNIRDVIAVRDRLKNELETAEKFLAIIRRQQDEDLAASAENRPPAPQPNLPAISTQNGNEYGSIGKIVTEVIKLCPVEFGVAQIYDAALRENHPLSKLQIGTVLARLLRQGKIETVKEKRGKSAAVYRRTSP